jgi:hypothetical protein
VTETPNARTEANRETIRPAFDAWSEGPHAISDVFAPDMVWRIEGHSLASKACKDKQQFHTDVAAPASTGLNTILRGPTRSAMSALVS